MYRNRILASLAVALGLSLMCWGLASFSTDPKVLKFVTGMAVGSAITWYMMHGDQRKYRVIYEKGHSIPMTKKEAQDYKAIFNDAQRIELAE